MFNKKKRQEKQEQTAAMKYFADLLAHLSVLEVIESKIHFDKSQTRVEIFGEADGQYCRVCEGVGMNLLEAIKDAFEIVRQQTGQSISPKAA